MAKDGSIIGKHLLIGLTYLDEKGSVKEQIQLHGLVTQVSSSTIVFERSDGEGDFSIPFDDELALANSEAVYTLRATGEEVTGVDLLSSWTIHNKENDQ